MNKKVEKILKENRKYQENLNRLEARKEKYKARTKEIQGKLQERSN